MNQYYQFIGNSPPMQQVYHIIESVAASDVPVLITGETGTGKELCAQAIHQASPRHNKLFKTLNCAAIPKNLLESELFGYMKGAFTGAEQAKPGIAPTVHQGSLFLDEIGELEFDLQSKLLRFIETGSFYPIGSNHQETVNIRFIAATNRDPFLDIKVGHFRSDLYYRLETIIIHLPPLRERGQDILLLAHSFLKQLAQKEQKNFQSFTQDAEKVLLSYEWPGNVRQLKNTIHNIILLNKGEKITADMVRAGLKNLIPLQPVSPTNYLQITEPDNEADAPFMMSVIIASGDTVYPFWQIEKEILLKTLEHCNGHVVKAAELLELSYASIYKKLRAWSIPVKSLKKTKF